MKKIIKSLIGLAFAAMLAMPIMAENKSITVPAPTLTNGTGDDAWIPAYVQGLLTTNFQNYSEMEVIDRMNTAKIMKEQKLAESMADMQNEADQIKIGKLVSAKYTVAVQIIKKGGDYSLDIKVDDTEKGTAIGKAYTNPSCSNDDLKNGRAIYLASYDLLKGLGVNESKLKGLKDAADAAGKTQSEAVKNNTSVAKGIVAERNGNVVEAMAYFNQANNIAEAAERLGQIEVSITTGNYGGESLETQVANEIQRRFQQKKLEEQWEKIWEQYIKYEEDNWAVVTYYSDFETGEIHYGKDVESSTVDLNMQAKVDWNPECKTLLLKLLDLAKKAGVKARPAGLISSGRFDKNRFDKMASAIGDNKGVPFLTPDGIYRGSIASYSGNYANPYPSYEVNFNLYNGDKTYHNYRGERIANSDLSSRQNYFSKVFTVTFKNVPVKIVSDKNNFFIIVTAGIKYYTDSGNSFKQAANVTVLVTEDPEKVAMRKQSELVLSIIDKKVEFIKLPSGLEISKRPLKYGDIIDLDLDRYYVQKYKGSYWLADDRNNKEESQQEFKKYAKKYISLIGSFNNSGFPNKPYTWSDSSFIFFLYYPYKRFFSAIGENYRLPTYEEIQELIANGYGGKKGILGSELEKAARFPTNEEYEKSLGKLRARTESYNYYCEQYCVRPFNGTIAIPDEVYGTYNINDATPAEECYIYLVKNK